MEREGVTEVQSEEEIEPEMSSDPGGESEQEKEDDEIKEDDTVRQGEREGGEMRDVEDWNGFLAAGEEHAAQEEVVLDWKPGDPVTPQYVLRDTRIH